MIRNLTANTSLPIYNLIALLEDAKKGYLNASEKIKDEVLSLINIEDVCIFSDIIFNRIFFSSS